MLVVLIHHVHVGIHVLGMVSFSFEEKNQSSGKDKDKLGCVLVGDFSVAGIGYPFLHVLGPSLLKVFMLVWLLEVNPQFGIYWKNVTL